MDERELTAKQIQFMKRILTWIAELINSIDEPIDPKVLALLEIAHDIVEQQMEMDIAFDWEMPPELPQDHEDDDDGGEAPGQQFLFFDNDKEKEETPEDIIPSPEELSRWFGETNGDKE